MDFVYIKIIASCKGGTFFLSHSVLCPLSSDYTVNTRILMRQQRAVSVCRCVVPSRCFNKVGQRLGAGLRWTDSVGHCVNLLAAH